MEVVAIDITPVKPYIAQYVSLGIGKSNTFCHMANMYFSDSLKGQRFDAVMTANGTVANYWPRALPMNCANSNYYGKGTQNAIISYTSDLEALPTTTAAPVHDDCLDEPAEKTILFVTKSVDIANFEPRYLSVASPFKIISDAEGRVFRWSIGNTEF
jgi:hypothetical protein